MQTGNDLEKSIKVIAISGLTVRRTERESKEVQQGTDDQRTRTQLGILPQHVGKLFEEGSEMINH